MRTALSLIVTCLAVTLAQDVRLVDENGDTAVSSGRVEFLRDGVWGTVCNPGWGMKEAQRVCIDLGFPGAIDSSIGSGAEVPHYVPIWKDMVSCDGTENSFAECSDAFDGDDVYKCGHKDDGYASCKVIRLAARFGGFGTTEGRVEVFKDGSWGTVCGSGFTDNSANMVCAQVLSVTARAVSYSATYGEGSGPIHLSGVNCRPLPTGQDMLDYIPDILSCPRSDAVSTCQHIDDIGVSCKLTGLRLRDEGGNLATSRGRIEIGRAGSVCDRLFGKTDGDVVCKQLGYPRGAMAIKPAAFFGQGTGRILMDGVDCSATDRNLMMCDKFPDVKPGCDHDRDVGVICDAGVRLVAEDGSVDGNAGILEVYVNNQWGRVCNNGFKQAGGDLVCKLLGFNNGASSFGDYMGPNSDGTFPNANQLQKIPILMQGLDCQGNEHSALSCSYVKDVDTQCNYRNLVALTCGPAGQAKKEVSMDDNMGKAELLSRAAELLARLEADQDI